VQPSLHLNSTGSWIDEYTLKYGWPGSISETIQDAYVGNLQRSDPDGLYLPEFHAFESEISRCGGENSPVVAPRVLKPQPGTGDSGRAPLYAAADQMESDTLPQAHYRFYAYTDAAAAANSYASGGWANATNGTMCASYLWEAFKAANVTLEGGVMESGDRGDLMLPGETTLPPDGLYRYDAAERADAASAMYTSCYNNAYNGLGFWKAAWTNLVYDNIEDVCSQVVACFAQDQCGKLSGGTYLSTLGVDPNTANPDGSGSMLMTEKEYVGTGTTVAPDDLMNWDVYPYSEELVYRPTWIRPRYRWVAATGTSDIDVNVKMAGTLEPVANATVTLQNAAKESDANGLIHFTAIPTGSGLLNGWKMLADGHFLRGATPVTVVSGANSPVELLLADDFRYRKVVITLNGLIHEDEGSSLYTEDEVPINGEQKTIFLDVSTPSGQWLFRPACCGGEVTGEADFFVNEDETGGITLTGNIRLWEGTSCKDNLRASGPFTSGVYIPRDSTQTFTGVSAHYGPDPDNYDFFNLDTIKVENYQETFPNPALP